MLLHFEERRHRYTVDGCHKPSVTQVLEAARLLDLSGIPSDILRRAAARGKRVHKAAVLRLADNLDWATVHDADGGYVLALDKFLRESGFVADPARIERMLYCADHGYCGTPDVEGMYRIRSMKLRTVLDWKTGIMHAVRYQLAAYAHALGIRHRIAVKLNADGTYRMEWFPPETLRQDLGVFLKALAQTREEGCWAA